MSTTERYGLIAVVVVLGIVSILAIALGVYSDIEEKRINVMKYEICMQTATTDTQRNACNEVNK